MCHPLLTLKSVINPWDGICKYKQSRDLSLQTCISSINCKVSPPVMIDVAVTVTGEWTVEPFTGEHAFTPVTMAGRDGRLI